MVIFYRPYNIHKMKIFFNKKTFVQENEVLPDRLKLGPKDAEEDYKAKFLDGIISDGYKKEKDDVKEKKKILARTMKKNTNENLEFIDEVKMNIIQNTYLKRKLTKAQMKLLPIAHVNKISKNYENGKYDNEKEVDILEVYKRFKTVKLGKDACKEIKVIRQFVLENTGFLEDEINDLEREC